MAFDRNNRFFRELAARIVHDPSAIIPFVGAGLSHYGVGDAKLPLWRQLIERLKEFADELGVLNEAAADRVERLLHDGTLIAATDLLVDAIGPTLFRSFIRKELDVANRPLSPAALSLVMIAWSIIVTTNLDEMLEKAIEQKFARRPPVVTHRHTPELIDAINSPRTGDIATLAKIHGTLDDFASWCLTEKHYQRLMQRSDYQEILRSLFLKRLFFVGFGLADRDFDLVQEYLERIFPDGDVDCYALVPDSMKGLPRISYLIQVRGVKPIYYAVASAVDPMDPFGGHAAMYECLAALADAWVSANADVRVSLKNLSELDPAFVGRTDELATIDRIVFDRNRSLQIIGFGGEGKTSLAQEWIRTRRLDLQRYRFDLVFGFSFYSGSVDRFIDDCFLDVCQQKSPWDVARRLRFICEEAGHRRILFLMDGLESLLDQSGTPTNPYLREFLEQVERTDSRIIITSRLEVPGPFVVLPVGPLRPIEIDLLAQSQTPHFHPATLKSILERAQGHALSIRLSLAMPKTDAPSDTMPWEADAPADVLTANKLERTLSYYDSILSPEEHAFLTCFSVFERPTRYDLIERAFLAEITGFDTNAPLRRIDLRKVVRSLLAKRLLIASAGTQITTHPNVRDYFRKRSSDLAPLHAMIARQLMSSTVDQDFTTLSEAEVFFDICHHAAGAGLWSEFHHVFNERLMREDLDYLCDSLGAWSETLAITSKTFPNGDLTLPPAYEPEYYASHHARCLKHLGFAAEATAAYLRALTLCAASEHPESALYTNNFLTLQAYAGNLVKASRLAPWNLALLNWIKLDWKRRWQIEHGAYSIAWLALILGDLKTARELFLEGEMAWVGSPTKRIEIFDHYPLYLIELFLNEEPPDLVMAEGIVSRMLDAAERNHWPETLVRAHIARSVIDRFRATQNSDASREACIDRARSACEKAAEAAKSLFAPPVDIELLIEQLRLDLHHAQFPLDHASRGRRLDKLGILIERLGWLLHQPELLALKGLAAHAAGQTGNAEKYLSAAEIAATKQGNRLAACGVSQSLPVLRARLGARSGPTFDSKSGHHADLAQMDYARPLGARFAETLKNAINLPPLAP